MNLSNHWPKLISCDDLLKNGFMIKWAEPAVSLCMFEKVLRRVLTTTRAHPTVSEPTWNVILEAVAVQQTVKVMQESTMVAHEDVDIHPLWVTGRRCINKAAMWTVNCTANIIKQCKTKGFEYLISLIDHWIKSIFAEYTNENRIVLRYMNMQFLNCSCYLWFKDN